MNSIASAIRVDLSNDNWEQRTRCIRLFDSFFHYLGHNEKSPLSASIAKLSLKPDRWLHIVAWPFGFSYEATLDYAKEAKKMALALNGQAKAESKKAFDFKIEESLEEGSGWLHKFVKNDKCESPHIKISQGYITNPSDISEYHSEQWGKHWKRWDEDAVQSVKAAVAELIRHVQRVQIA